MATPLFLAQQVFSALLNNGQPMSASQQCTNSSATASTPSASPTPTAPAAFPTDLTSLVTFLFGLSALRDWLKLIVIGSIFESLRRFGVYVYHKSYSCFFITARFDEDDLPYSWMMLWLTQQPSFTASARDVQVTSESFGLPGACTMIQGEEIDASEVMGGARPLALLPAVDHCHTMWYRKHWMRVTRSTREGSYGRREQILEVCIFAWSYSILNQLLIDAKKAYNAAQEHRVSIFVSDTDNHWRYVSSRPKRSIDSIVLDPGIKDLLLEDARDFLGSKAWYTNRGIPFRRGYLLYGAPGSGKTSIIHSLAGELGLNVYIVSLSRAGLDDTALSALIADLPEKCIALMEDIDAAFSQTLSREDDEDEEDDLKKKKKKGQQSGPPSAPTTTSRVSLSGLLNALDGVGAQEGRILFATTNKYHSLDPALCRPGRMDLHIEFNLASKYQAQELYRRFYLPADDEEGPAEPVSGSDSGYVSEVDEKDLLVSRPPSPASLPSSSALGLISSHRTKGPKLSKERVEALAEEFAEAIPEREFSMASLQGYLMTCKSRPVVAAKEAAAWVEKERAEKKRLAALKTKKAATTPVTDASGTTANETSVSMVKVEA